MMAWGSFAGAIMKNVRPFCQNDDITDSVKYIILRPIVEVRRQILFKIHFESILLLFKLLINLFYILLTVAIGLKHNIGFYKGAFVGIPERLRYGKRIKRIHRCHSMIGDKNKIYR